MSSLIAMRLSPFLVLMMPALFLCALARAETPNVVVTIKPVHSIVASVMEGAGEPALLLSGASSPHAYALKPSDRSRLNDAALIIRVSRHLETFLDKVAASLPPSSRMIDLDTAPGLTLLPARTGGTFEAHMHAKPGQEGDDAEMHDEHDVHIWLDPLNAAIMATFIARTLSEADPEHASLYRANADALVNRLDMLSTEISREVAPARGKPFIVFHDVMQYFENRYGLAAAGAVAVSPERQPGAMRVALLRRLIERSGAICVFAEPQFPPKLIGTLIENTRAQQGTLDEIGVAIPEGPEHYFAFMRQNAASLAGCLR